MLLRGSNVAPQVQIAALSALRLSSSLIPFLNLHCSSSKLPTRNLLIIPPPNSSSYSYSYSYPSYGSRLVSAMSSGRLSPKATASFSAESSSEVDREILVQHLLVKEDDQKLLLELLKRIAQGEDLSDLAVKHSICPSKEDGGMLGWVRKGQMVPEFEQAAFTAPLNKVVRCKSKFGWHLLQVLSEREESLLTEIQPDELHVKMQDPSFSSDAQLIDVREPHEVEKASLPGFQILPLRQFGSWGPEVATKFDLEKETYVLCHHGVRSLQVAKWLHLQVEKVKIGWFKVEKRIKFETERNEFILDAEERNKRKKTVAAWATTKELGRSPFSLGLSSAPAQVQRRPPKSHSFQTPS